MSGLGSILALREAGRKTPLFCFHPGGGLAWCYSGLLQHIPRGHPVFGLQDQVLDRGEKLPRTLDEMAAAYAERIRTLCPNGPYALAGWSFGGLVAQAAAVHLQDRGEQVALLAMLDARRKDTTVDRTPNPRELLSQTFEGIDAIAAESGAGPIPPKRVREILAEQGSVLAGLSEETIERLMAVTANNLKLGNESVQQHFHGDVLIFEPSAAPAGHRASDFWEPWITGEIIRRPVPFAHHELLGPAALDVIGPELARALQETE
jgi:thioesterase domain-containing protein